MNVVTVLLTSMTLNFFFFTLLADHCGCNDSVIENLSLQNDIIFLCETWRDKCDTDLLSWDDEFEEFSTPAVKDFKRWRSSGGTSLLIRKSILPHCSVIKQDAYRIWCKINKTLFTDHEAENDIFICLGYIRPERSRLYKVGKSFNFEKLIFRISNIEW